MISVDVEQSDYEFYLKVLERCFLRYVPVNPDMDSPLNSVKNPLDAIVRVLLRLSEKCDDQSSY